MLELVLTVALIVGVMLLVSLLLIPVAIARGYVLSKMWGWFMVPFFGLPALGIAQAIGVSYVIGLLTHQHVGSQQKKGRELVIELSSHIIGWFIMLGCGWVLKTYFL